MINNKYIKIYAVFLKSFLNPQRKLKVIFDCSNGTTGPILKKTLTSNRLINFKLINQIPDGNFPAHGPNPLKPGALVQIKKEIKRQKADLGIIFDADGDRAFFLDSSGKQIDPDAIAKLLIWQIKPRKIVIDPRTSWLIKNPKNIIKGTQMIESRVGHYFIKNLMRKTKAEFGAERSGHYYFSPSPNFYFDSGILTAIQTINALSKLPYSLENFLNLIPKYYHSKEINFEINPKTKNLKIKAVKKYFSKKANKISELDGLTMEFDDWWFNIRNSNTESFIRLNIEAAKKQTLVESIKKVYHLISSFK